MLVLIGLLGPPSAEAQTTVQLPEMVIEVKHTEYAFTQNTGTPSIAQVKSSNPSVATAAPYRTDRVQIVAVAPGRTTVEFFDQAERKQYVQPVWVTAVNATGGGGSNYDPTKTQLDEIVMLVKRTQNVAAPGNAPHQISGVKSSNPSVATARTNTSGTIQVYSVALGDTFIEFTDNAKRTTYQVHVWVRDSVSSVGGAPKPGPTPPGPKPDSGPKPHPGPIAVDRCLVGTWVSDTVTNDFTHWDNGGAGIVLTVDTQGRVSLNYSGMAPNQSNGATTSWTGRAAGRIATNGRQGLDVVSVGESSVAATTTFRNGAPPYTGPLVGLGNVLQNQPTYAYTCDANRMTLKSFVFSSTWRREK